MGAASLLWLLMLIQGNSGSLVPTMAVVHDLQLIDLLLHLFSTRTVRLEEENEG